MHISCACPDGLARFLSGSVSLPPSHCWVTDEMSKTGRCGNRVQVYGRNERIASWTGRSDVATGRWSGCKWPGHRTRTIAKACIWQCMHCNHVAWWLFSPVNSQVGPPTRSAGRTTPSIPALPPCAPGLRTAALRTSNPEMDFWPQEGLWCVLSFTSDRIIQYVFIVPVRGHTYVCI